MRVLHSISFTGSLTTRKYQLQNAWQLGWMLCLTQVVQRKDAHFQQCCNVSGESWKRSRWKLSKMYPQSNSGWQIQKHTKCFKLFTERTLYLVHVSLNGTQGSEWGMRTVTPWTGNLRLSNKLKLTQDQLYINQEKIHLVLYKDWRKMKICMKCVPHHITGKQKGTVTTCEGSRQTGQTNPHCMLQHYGGKSWVFQYDSETDHSIEWRSSLMPKGFFQQRPGMNAMTITFTDKMDVINKKCVPKWREVNSNFMFRCG